jgi:F-type H+-transporting ATPase subunit a
MLKMHKAPIIEIGGFNLDLSIVLMLLVSGTITFVIAKLATRNLSVTNPSKMQNFLEWLVEFVRNIIASAMDLKKGKPFVALGMTLIMFIFVSNLLGLPFAIVTEYTEPGHIFGKEIVTTSEAEFAKLREKGEEHPHIGVVWWKSPTADVSVTFGLALIVFILVHYLGLTRNTKHYLKHYVHPYAVFLPLNLIEQIARPATLGIRLFANIYAGEILISTIIMAGVAGIPLMIAWQGFSIFVGAIQAFLFTILTMVYIAQAIVHEEH